MTPSRATEGRPAAPVRAVHLGLGNFFRAHQAWYTEHAPDSDEWGIAAFTGRSPGLAARLRAQDGLYTLLVRGAGGTRTEVVSSISAVHAAGDLDALRRYFSSSAVAVVTITVTEAGYCRDGNGGLDTAAPAVAADIAALAGDPLGGEVGTTPGRLVAGLLARRAAGAGPIAVVPCDNVGDNGAMVHRIVTGLATRVDAGLVGWIDDHVSFVTTTVDRITPRTTDDDVAEAGDQLAVATEPFAEWVLAGDFPGGRPAWDARYVDDVRPFETRKLWLLNGAHSIMAYAGSIRGHVTVADAIADPEVAGWVEEWWDAAARHLTLPAADVEAYRRALLGRFSNPQIRHLLAQIAADGSQKVPIRALPVLLAERAAGSLPEGVTRLLAAWVAHLRGHGVPVTDAHADEVTALAVGTVHEAVATTLAWLGVDDGEVAAQVERQVVDLVASEAALRCRPPR